MSDMAAMYASGYDPGKETAMIELTQDQIKLLAAQPQGPVLNPETQEVYFLVRKDVYERMCRIVDAASRRGWDDPELDVYEQYRKKP